jgi:hypothetical protein
MKRPAHVLAVALAIAACSDDAQPPAADKGGPVVDKGTTSGDKGPTTGDKGPTTGDKGPTAGDKGPAAPPILANNHPGWKKTSCGQTGCHSLPVKGHTTSAIGECAKCHGGNGACNPNGPNSKKKDHTPTLDCTTCHKSKHGFSSATDCQSCHYAAKGTSDC